MEPKEDKIVVEHGTDVTLVRFEEENILEEQQIRRLERALLPIVRQNEEKRLVLNFRIESRDLALLGTHCPAD